MSMPSAGSPPAWRSPGVYEGAFILDTAGENTGLLGQLGLALSVFPSIAPRRPALSRSPSIVGPHPTTSLVVFI